MSKAFAKLLRVQGKNAMNELQSIDLHTHVYLPRYMEMLRSRDSVPFVRSIDGQDRLIILPDEQKELEGNSGKEGIASGRPIGEEYYSMDRKIAYMDVHGIQTSLLSLANPWLDFLSLSEQKTLAKSLNEDMRDICRTHSSRFLSFGVIPQGLHEALEELDHIATLDNVKGVILGTKGLGNGLDDPHMLSFYQKVADLGLTIFLHPHYGLGNERFTDYGHALHLALGFTFETTAAVSRLLLSGLLDQVSPDLQILLAHSGGTMPFLAGRLDSCVAHDPALNAKLKHPPSHYLKTRFWYDGVAYHPPALHCLIEFAGIDRVVWGTDHPFFPPQDESDKMGGTWASTVSNYDILSDLTKEDQSKILRDNAKVMLRL